MTTEVAALLEEEFRLKRLRRIVDRAAADLRWRTESDLEAESRIAEARRLVLELFPGRGALFDRIYRGRLQRIFNEREDRNRTLYV